jgi:hypothetical protein
MSHSNSRAANRVLVRQGERGSALLIVLVFAAILAISLYKEMPVVVFESQRQKEQLLIDRGNQYAQGIKLFVRKTGQYPPSLEALENTNRMRFLRKRFKDPFTGKDDWRLLHSGPGGMIVDSKVNPMAANGAGGANGTNNLGSPNGTTPGNTGFGSQTPSNSGFGGFNNANSNNANNNNAGGNSASGSFNTGLSMNNANANTGMAPAGGPSQNAGGFGGFNSAAGNGGGSFGGYLSNLNANGGSGNPAAPSGIAMRQRAAAIAANGAPAMAQSGAAPMPVNNGSPASDQSSNPSAPNGSDPNANPNGPAIQVRSGLGPRVANNENITPINQSGGPPNNQNSPFNNQPGAFNNQPGAFNNQPGAFNNQPGGINNQSSPFANRTAPGSNTSGGLSGPGSASGMGVMQGGMIAGVASKAEGTGIKTVNDQDRYQLWEFVYDASKDAARQRAGAINQTGAAAGAPNQGNSGLAQGANPGNSGFGNSGFGNGNSGFGNQSNNALGNSNRSGFGNSSSGFGNSAGGFGNSNSGFGNSGRGFGNSNSGFGNSSSGFGSSNPGTSSNNGWSNNSNMNTTSQPPGASPTARPQR